MNKLSFVKWGIRPFNIALFMAYPTMGAFFTMPDFELMTLVRLAIFSFFNVLFITHIYIINDWSDARLIPEEPQRRKKQALKYPEVMSERDVLMLAAALAVVSLTGFAVISMKIFLFALGLFTITFLYSHPRYTLKQTPFGGVTAHFIGAFLYFIAGWLLYSPLDRGAAAMGLFFGMVIIAGNFFNEIEDFYQDLDVGLRTAAVAFGQRPVFMMGLFLFTFSSVYFVFLALYGLIPFHLIWPGLGLTAFWIVMAVRFRKWRGGDSSGSFRLAGRMAYAAFCIISVAIILVDRIRI